MIGIIYLLLCITVGSSICYFAFPRLRNLTTTTYTGVDINVSPLMLTIPVWFFTGTLALTWATYIFATLFRNFEKSLTIANGIVIFLSFFVILFSYFYQTGKSKKEQRVSRENSEFSPIEFMLLGAISALAIILMWTTFYIKDNQLFVGITVFSDFSPHLGMIRSFSYGNNFPTVYSHFAGEDIKYHFMFQFLVGNLEYLGLRIDYAFNIPSILSFVGAFMLLYVLAVKLTGKVAAGVFACLFFAFRSSKTLFTYLSNLPKGSIVRNLNENLDFISTTPKEEWGLWNLNVYANQRHLAFGLGVMFFIIILFLPHLYETWLTIKKYKINSTFMKMLFHTKDIFFAKEGWAIKDMKLAITSGVLLGSLAFFHGSAVIAALLVLFVFAIIARRRLEFLIVAVLAVLISMLQSKYFIHNSVFSPELLFGFIAENTTLFGVASYLDRLLGILPIVLLAALCLEKGSGRYVIFAFTAPFIFAFTVSLTVDVTVNHKYIMMSTILLGIFAAGLIVKIWERKDILLRVVSILLVIALTSTGIYDFATVLKKNKRQGGIVLAVEHPLTEWIKENSSAEDIFLTASYALNQVVFGGAMLFQGHQYFAWSAGYDTYQRDQYVRLMYEAGSPQELDSLVKENNIRYIIVDEANRSSSYYDLNEVNIRNTYQCVYQEGEGHYKISIYDTQLPMNGW